MFRTQERLYSFYEAIHCLDGRGRIFTEYDVPGLPVVCDGRD